MSPSPTRRVALVTLGCARNEVDSEELAGRLAADGWTLVDADDASGPGGADAVLVNTCGFIAAAKQDSIDTVLAAADGGPPVVAVGCLAERYGSELADALPEASAVLGFDAYPAIGAHLDSVLRGEPPPAHTPRDRRTLLPITPVERAAGSGTHGHVHVPGHGHGSRTAGQDGSGAEIGTGGPLSGPRQPRRRLGAGPVAPLKLASGCDRRCTFCAIPSFRGAFVSRPPDEVLAEAEWLAADGVRELVLVSENSTSYGKDLGDLRALESLLPRLAAVPGIVRVRPVYLQPAEVRPGLLEVLLTTPGIAPYLDLSFQHASATVLRRMRRFGDGDRFLELLASARALAPELGARSNVIVGFPGETRADVAALERFLAAADLDAIGVFGYSDEDGTAAAELPDKVTAASVARRVRRLTDLAEQLTAARAQARVGSEVEVLVEETDPDGHADADGAADGHGRGDGHGHGPLAEGRAAHQQPDVDGSCVLRTRGVDVAVGDLVRARVVAAHGVDLVTEVVRVVDRAPRPSPVRPGRQVATV